MALFYCVKIRSSGLTCSSIKSSGGQFTLGKHGEFKDKESLKRFISNKKNVNFLLFESRFLRSSMSINRSISDRSSINSMIFSKLQKEYSEIDDIRFKSSVIEDNKNKDTIKYAINGIYQNSKSYDIFNKLKTFKNCNLISLENYALYSLAKNLLPNNAFISAWVDEKSITVVAGTKNELLYSRSENIENTNLDISREIAKNIMFVKQKVREVKFDALVLNGSIFDDQNLFSTIYEQAKIPISSFYPVKSIFRKFSPKDFNDNLIELGSLYIDYTLDFTSKQIKSHIQYDKVLKLYMPILLGMMIYFGSSAYDNYSKYYQSKSGHDRLMSELTALYPVLKVDYKNKDTLNKLLSILQTHSNKELLDQISNIKQNIDIVNNTNMGLFFKQDLENFVWNANNISSLEFLVEKSFLSLNELNKFKDDIVKLETKLKTNVKLEPTYNLNTLTCSIKCIFYGVSNGVSK